MSGEEDQKREWGKGENEKGIRVAEEKLTAKQTCGW